MSKLPPIDEGLNGNNIKVSRVHARNKQLVEEKETLGRRKDQLNYLRENAELFLDCGK